MLIALASTLFGGIDLQFLNVGVFCGCCTLSVKLSRKLFSGQ